MTLPQFEQFWQAYPKERRVGKGYARKKFLAIDETLFGAIMEAIEAKVEDWKRTKISAQYIPHPSTWINQGRWEDTIDGFKMEEYNDYELAELLKTRPDLRLEAQNTRPTAYYLSKF